jgi:nicotinamide mononucleotide transporter
MNDWWQPIIDGFAKMSGWEAFAALLGLGYIIFAARESLWCWPMAFISTLIYTVLFWEGQLPMQALLNFYYMGMAIYGYMLWRKHGQQEDNLAITSWGLAKHIAYISTGVVLTWLTASYLQSIDASQRPYLDASVTIFSVMNTMLMARKILQNWLYWIIIDAAAIVLYYQTGYFATVALFAVYTVLAFVGYINWKRLYDSNTDSNSG